MKKPNKNTHKKMNKEKLDKAGKEHYRRLEEVHVKTLLNASQSYDKAILSLATATLGFTFAFVEFAKSDQFNCICLLYEVWVLLIVSIICMLVSFQADQYSSQKKIVRYGNMADDGKWRSANDKVEEYLMEWMPLISGITFVGAIILFTFFVINNIPVDVGQINNLMKI